MGNRISLETDNDIVKVVIKLDTSFSEDLIKQMQGLPWFKS